ncbi:MULTISPECIES: tetratricopeptide repeat protein [unclassified Oceanispirochaeta]|uniref:tetratricopeptide repeat protein n=1 Tax=unclassified Oceanispirochaeta TaxID=2635722 RepID=UPI001314FB9C|nr:MULTISPECIES: tetratricopeptide repeat protein [unclassified Oceanispirochaeta]MBF9016350.1 tetratricopeptide repeat protein [Oceanispirochaeta sp. M2]NPD72812.1 tetratricopeptide repeat protein [Oceanispirochaeta sp. M1]
MKKVLFFTLLMCFLSVFFVQAESPFTILTQPTMMVPLGPATDGVQNFSLGGGVLLEGEFNLKTDNFLKYLHFGPQLEYGVLPINAGSTIFSMFNFGANAGVKISPLPRTILRAWGGGGASLGMYQDESGLFPYYTAGTDVKFRLSPTVDLGVGARYLQGQSSIGTIYQGVAISLGLGYKFQSGSRGADLHFTPNTTEIYPLYYTWYDENPLGDVLLTNNSSEKIRNIRTSFYVPQYMDQPKYSDTVIHTMAKGDSETIPLQGLFTTRIFEINEGLKVAGEITVEYEYYGKTYSESVPLTVYINNKNAMTWDDDRKAACFVTANNPLVYSYARSVSGKVRRDAVGALDKNFQIGMGLFEAMTLYGLGYVVDPSSAYTELSANELVVDYIQFPQQTLISQGGDCDDLSVLYASMLEASGIPAAFITIPGHIYVAYQLGLSEQQAKRKFPSADNLLYVDGKPWLPVEVTLVDDGFLYSWQIGARQIRENNGEYGFFPVREAWEYYPPAEYESVGIAYLPNPNEVLEQHEKELNRFLKLEINGQVASINRQIQEDGKSHILYNKMGVTYARYGFYDDALTWFNKVIREKDFYPSLMNMGNIYYLLEDPDQASRYYSKALAVKPDSENALVGLARVSSELEDYDTANAALATLAAINPDSAKNISHLGTSGIGRASSAQNREIDEWSEE